MIQVQQDAVAVVRGLPTATSATTFQQAPILSLAHCLPFLWSLQQASQPGSLRVSCNGRGICGVAALRRVFPQEAAAVAEGGGPRPVQLYVCARRSCGEGDGAGGGLLQQAPLPLLLGPFTCKLIKTNGMHLSRVSLLLRGLGFMPAVAGRGSPLRLSVLPDGRAMVEVVEVAPQAAAGAAASALPAAAPAAAMSADAAAVQAPPEANDRLAAALGLGDGTAYCEVKAGSPGDNEDGGGFGPGAVVGTAPGPAASMGQDASTGAAAAAAAAARAPKPQRKQVVRDLQPLTSKYLRLKSSGAELYGVAALRCAFPQEAEAVAQGGGPRQVQLYARRSWGEGGGGGGRLVGASPQLLGPFTCTLKVLHSFTLVLINIEDLICSLGRRRQLTTLQLSNLPDGRAVVEVVEVEEALPRQHADVGTATATAATAAFAAAAASPTTIFPAAAHAAAAARTDRHRVEPGGAAGPLPPPPPPRSSGAGLPSVKRGAIQQLGRPVGLPPQLRHSSQSLAAAAATVVHTCLSEPTSERPAALGMTSSVWGAMAVAAAGDAAALHNQQGQEGVGPSAGVAPVARHPLAAVATTAHASSSTAAFVAALPAAEPAASAPSVTPQQVPRNLLRSGDEMTQGAGPVAAPPGEQWWWQQQEDQQQQWQQLLQLSPLQPEADGLGMVARIVRARLGDFAAAWQEQ